MQGEPDFIWDERREAEAQDASDSGFARVRLEVNGRLVHDDATSAQIADALAGLPGGSGDSFAILSRSDQRYVQTAGSAREGFRVEYREGSDAAHFATSDLLSLDQVTATFCSYAGGDDAYKTLVHWEPMALPSPGEARATAIRATRSTAMPSSALDAATGLLLGGAAVFLLVDLMGRQPDPLPLRVPCWMAGAAIATLAHFGTTSWNDEPAPMWGAFIYAGAMLGLMGGVYLASEFAGQVATKVFVDLFLGFITGAVALESAFHLLRFAKPRPAQ